MKFLQTVAFIDFSFLYFMGVCSFVVFEKIYQSFVFDWCTYKAQILSGEIEMGFVIPVGEKLKVSVFAATF